MFLWDIPRTTNYIYILPS
uniref:Uncharacterized protein n=1 Tax=Lepeophtheirus salmonis TaxID=72036 RepID=A0A0K2V1T7_LEPSM